MSTKHLANGARNWKEKCSLIREKSVTTERGSERDRPKAVLVRWSRQANNALRLVDPCCPLWTESSCGLNTLLLPHTASTRTRPGHVPWLEELFLQVIPMHLSASAMCFLGFFFFIYIYFLINIYLVAGEVTFMAKENTSLKRWHAVFGKKCICSAIPRSS